MARLTACLLALVLAACGSVRFERPGSGDPLQYAQVVRSYAEYCALSQIRKKRGNGAEILGGIGGHAVFYLHGACRAAADGQTRILPCDDPGAEPGEGVGLSMNAHFRNAKWVAVPGREFFYHGDLRPEAPLDKAAYDRVQAEARRLRLYDGVGFHDVVFAEMPEGTPPEAWKYEVSIGTDYAIAAARGRFCARVPVNRVRLAAMIDFLNAENAPYREGRAEFRWSLILDNCIHLAHNALAAAGLWRPWPTHQPLLQAVFDFPVPRNEFVNLMRRTGDAALLRPDRLYADAAARRALLEYGQLPLRPGALMESRPPQAPNAIYETEVTLVFYDEPLLGPYQGWFDAIQADPRLHDLRSNLDWVAAEYRQALAERMPLAWWLGKSGLARRPGFDAPAFAATYAALYAKLEAGLAEVERQRARLEGP